MLLQAERIHRKATEIARNAETRDTVQIAKRLGIYVHYIEGLDRLLGMYTYRQRERHILLNANLGETTMQMVCAHEIGHDRLHRNLAKGADGLQEFTLFDLRSETEYEANAFGAHLLISDEALMESMRQGYDVVQMAALLETDVNLVLIKLNELNRMGWRLPVPYVPRADFLKNIPPREAGAWEMIG